MNTTPRTPSLEVHYVHLFILGSHFLGISEGLVWSGLGRWLVKTRVALKAGFDPEYLLVCPIYMVSMSALVNKHGYNLYNQFIIR